MRMKMAPTVRATSPTDSMMAKQTAAPRAGKMRCMNTFFAPLRCFSCTQQYMMTARFSSV